MRGGGSCHVFMRRFRRAGRVWGTVDLCRHLPTQEFSLLLLNNERLYYYLHSSSTLLSPSYLGGFKDLGFRSFSVLRNPLGFPHCWRGSQEEEDPLSKCNEDEKKNEQQYGGNHIGSASNWIGSVVTIYPHANGHGLRRDRTVWGHGFMPMLFKLPCGSAPRFYCSGSTIKQHNNDDVTDPSKRAVVTALWCNFLVFSLKAGVWFMTASHVMFAEVVHSAADFANQALLAYGLSSSRRAPDALHPYGYSKERFVWSLISAVGIFCLGCGATIVHGIQNLWVSQPPTNILLAALVIGGSFVMEGTSLIVAISAVRKGAAAEGMTIRDYLWRGHDPTSVAVMMEDGAAVTGLVIAALSLVAVNVTGNPIYDPLGSIFVGQLLGMVAIFLIQRNRHALIGRAIDPHDMKHVLNFLASDQVVDAIYDCKSEVIGPGSFRFKAEIDFNGVAIVQNYLQRTGRETWAREFREAVNNKDESALDRIMANYGEEVVSALGYEVDRLEKEIQRIVPGIQHVDIETHNPKGPAP